MALGAQCPPTPRLSAGRHQQCPWRLWGNTSPGGGAGVGECCPPSSDSSKPSGSRCQGGSWTMWPLPQEWHLGGGPPRPKESLPFMVKLPPPQTPCMGGVAGRLEPAPLEPWVSPLPRLCLGPAQGAGEDGVNNLVKFRDAAVEVQLEGNARLEEAGACSPPTPPPVKLGTAPWTSRPPSAHLGSAPASWGHWGTNPRMLGESPGGRSPGPRTGRRSGGGPGPRGRSQDADLRCQRLNRPYVSGSSARYGAAVGSPGGAQLQMLFSGSGDSRSPRDGDASPFWFPLFLFFETQTQVRKSAHRIHRPHSHRINHDRYSAVFASRVSVWFVLIDMKLTYDKMPGLTPSDQ